jgi:hypothetical protein
VNGEAGLSAGLTRCTSTVARHAGPDKAPRLRVLVNRHDWAMVAHDRALARLDAVHAAMVAAGIDCPLTDHPECRGEP